LNFKFELSDNTKKVLHAKAGEVILSSLFFLGAESDEDNETEEAYDIFEYRSNTENCFFSVRMAGETDANGKLRSKVIFGCSDISKPAMTLDESPVLRTE
jgi:hypothetical protein